MVLKQEGMVYICILKAIDSYSIRSVTNMFTHTLKVIETNTILYS